MRFCLSNFSRILGRNIMYDSNLSATNSLNKCTNASNRNPYENCKQDEIVNTLSSKLPF